MSTPMPDYGLSFESASTDSKVIHLLKAEQYAEKFLTDQISDPFYTHEIKNSQLWGIAKNGSFYLINEQPDVYELLSDSEIFDISNCIGIIIYTTGWAAPLSEDGKVEGMPSKHELRRRIALASCVTNQSSGSALSFADDKEMVLDPGSATGSLAEALELFWKRNRA